MIRINQFRDNVYILEDGFGCFCDLVVGRNKALLFDTGPGVEDIKAAVETITHLPLLVIASHGHFDHIGGSRFFDGIYLSAKDRNILDEYNEEQLNRWIMDMGCPADITPIRFGCGKWDRIEDLSFDRFDLGDLAGEIIELPGHSYGSVGIYFPSLKLLLSGDALSPVMVLMFKNHGTIADQYETVTKVLDLEIDHFLTAHNPKALTKDVLIRMADCLKNAESRKFYDYAYPSPPYGQGRIQVHSMEDEPVGLIVE